MHLPASQSTSIPASRTDRPVKRKVGRRSGSKVVVVEGRRRVFPPSPNTPSQPPKRARIAASVGQPPASAEEEDDDDDDDDESVIPYEPSPTPPPEALIVYEPIASPSPPPESSPTASSSRRRARPPTAAGTSAARVRSPAARAQSVARQEVAPTVAQRSISRATPPSGSGHPTFQADDQTDIIVVSSDGKGFPFRRAYLEAASAKVEADLASGALSGRRTRRSDHTLIDLDVPSVDLRIFLRFVHPRVADPTLTGCDVLLELVEIAERLEARPVVHALVSHGVRFVQDHAPALLALALKHEVHGVGAVALRAFAGGFVKAPLEEPGTYRYVPADWTVSDMPLALAEQLPVHIRELLLRYQGRMLDMADQAVRSWEPLAAELESDAAFLTSADNCSEFLADL